MTVDRDDLIRAFLADEARRLADQAPTLEAAVGRLAPRVQPEARGGSRGMIVLLAASLLLTAALGATIAIGSGLVRLPTVIDGLPTPTDPAHQAVFLRLEVTGSDREVVVIGIGEGGLERELARLPDAWIDAGPIAPMGAVSPSGLLAMPAGTSGSMRWQIHDLHDSGAAPVAVPGIEQDIEQLQATPYFAAQMRPSVFWGPGDQVAIPWYERLTASNDYHLSFVNAPTGDAMAVDIPDDLWILPRWTADGSGVLLSGSISDSTPRSVVYPDGTIDDAEDVEPAKPACRTRYDSGGELVISEGGVDRVSDDGRQQVAAAGNVTFACLAPDEDMVVFTIGIGDGNGAATASTPLAGLIVPGSGDWIEVEGSFAGWIEVVP